MNKPHLRFARARSLAVVAAFSATAVGGTSFISASAGADDVDTMISNMEELSRESAAANEQVLALEEQIDETGDLIEDSQLKVDASTAATAGAGAELARLDEEAAGAAALADAARASQDAVQSKLDDLASATYRGVVVDPLTNAARAEDPQSMIDRVSYMGVLADDASEELSQLKSDNVEAGQLATRANAAVAEAAWVRSQLANNQREAETAHNDLERHQAELEAQRADLAAQQAALQEQVAAVQSQVDALDPALLSRWQNKDNPLTPNTAGVGADGAVASALTRLGAPYSWGAAGPDAFDCSGLMFWSYQQEGKSIPRTSQAQLAGGTPVSRAELQPGDIVGYYPGVTHVAMYIGNGQVVHASDYGIPVQVVSVDSMPFQGAARY
ncbi:NlpC/P60 family protein [Corynebacterium doosanense]|uniref:Hydrolase n=1 Tax=Corynebacterium doosanense CAU 212 = DSM 45436 TaxID=558173 RepID=A0A097IH37_9CORY|nr:NlpC/P60 family protein [Corynebacterium doosanense]AIT61483.1 hydrolase [Corynebacterium doosanense CAU 212 = DSM 45436]